MKKTSKMTLDEALQAMKEGKEVTHDYLRHTETKTLRLEKDNFIDKEGYVLNKFSVYMVLQNVNFNDGWEIVENNN